MAKGKMVDFCGDSPDPFAVADLSDAYRQNGALRVRRGVKLVGRRSLLVQDELTLDAPSTVWWFLHTKASIDIASDGTTATLRQNDRQVLVYMLDAPSGAKLVAMGAKHLASSPGPTAGERGAEGYRKLALKLENVTSLRLAIALDPEGEQDAQTWQITPLSTWSASREHTV
jgi:hypothetical protein